MYVEQELRFLGRDCYRLSRSNAGVVVAGLLGEQVFSVIRLGFVGSCWMLAGTVALVGCCLVPLRRSRTSVGAEGISISWGFGRGRTYPWTEIRWVEVHETRNGNGTAQTVRITLADSRRRSLPAVQNSTIYPDRGFEMNVARIMTRWHAHTTEAARYKPPEKWRQRLSPTAWGCLVGVALVVLAVLVVAVVLLVAG